MARVRLFAGLREAAGTDRDEIEASTVKALLEEARAKYGGKFSEALGYASVAVNQRDIRELQGMETPIGPEDEVALLPPVSGGRLG